MKKVKVTTTIQGVKCTVGIELQNVIDVQYFNPSFPIGIT